MNKAFLMRKKIKYHQKAIELTTKERKEIEKVVGRASKEERGLGATSITKREARKEVGLIKENLN